MIEPLVPPWVDLRKFDDMPLAVKRLRDSRFAAKVNPEEFRSGVLLWCAAWHQIPAASLPNDDAELAQLAGYGFAIKEWMRVRKGALHGWQEATDSRLYNETAAEKAMKSWASMVESAYRKFADRWRKENAKRKERKEPPLVICTLSHWKEVTCSSGIPSESTVDSTGKITQATGNAELAQGIPPDFQTKERNGKEGLVLPTGVPTPTVGASAVDKSTPDGDKSPTNQRRNGRRPTPPTGWHETNAGIEAAARLLNTPARPGEKHGELKARLFAKIYEVEEG